MKGLSAILITKEAVYPANVLTHVACHECFDEIVVLTKQTTVAARYEAMQSARCDWVYVQDDDAFCPIDFLVARVDTGAKRIVCAMKPHYIDSYKDLKCCLVGWGAVMPRWMALSLLDNYVRRYGQDEIYRTQADRIVTGLNWPQVRLDSDDIVDLPTAYSPDRMSMQPDHYTLRDEALRRVEALR